VNRRRGAGKVVDLVDFNIEWKSHIVTHKFEARLGVQVVNILLSTGEQIVDAEHLVAQLKQPVREVRAQEASAACYQHSLAASIQSAHEYSLYMRYTKVKLSIELTVEENG
jgi:Fe2+ transport system protein B